MSVVKSGFVARILILAGIIFVTKILQLVLSRWAGAVVVVVNVTVAALVKNVVVDVTMILIVIVFFRVVCNAKKIEKSSGHPRKYCLKAKQVSLCCLKANKHLDTQMLCLLQILPKQWNTDFFKNSINESNFVSHA